MNRSTIVFLTCALFSGVQTARGGIAGTAHDLTVSGGGAPGATGSDDICEYCHTPHGARTTRALWSRDIPPRIYSLYTSSTLEANLRQPTGASRLCLSCHDGTTALGNLRWAKEPGFGTAGREAGGSLGTDLSDDHPISFVYDTGLVLKQGQLVDPQALPKEIHLDGSQQMQCTSCHDPHEDRFGNFLRIDNRGGALCTACHRQRGWKRSPHARSHATWNGIGRNPWQNAPYQTVTDNGCRNCHQPHGAPQPQRLLKSGRERGICLECHDGSVAMSNLEREFAKTSAHRVVSFDWTHDPSEDPLFMPRHVSCSDCHNPHQSTQSPALPPSVPGVMRGVTGVNISGRMIAEAQNEYEVCIKCHGDRDFFTEPGIVRVDDIRNIRLKIDPGNASFHPIAAVGRNTSMEGLVPGYSAWSLIYCTDCHNNDEWTPSGSRPRGPHGSRYAPILEREYRTNHEEPESYQAYSMCYKCHDRVALLRDRPGDTFSHRTHLLGERPASCAVCHDAHGSRDSGALINFMLRDKTGRAVMGSTPGGQGPQYVEFGPDRGKCYLLCHGKNHDPL